MKKLINQLLLFSGVAGMLFITSCGSDDDPTPSTVTISVSGDTDTQGSFDPTETVNFTIGYTAEAGISSFIYTPTVDGTIQQEVILNPSVDLGLDLTTQSNEGSFNFGFELNETLAGTDVAITFEIVDQDGGSASETVNFSVNNTPNVAVYEAFLLAAPLGDGSSNTFYSTNLGTRYSENDVLNSTESISAEIDFGYYYGATDFASIAGIEAYPTNIVNVDAWNVQNVTLFRNSTLTPAEFDAIAEFDGDEIAAEFEVGSSEAGQKTQLQEGDVFAFKTDGSKTDGSKFGLLKVVSITGTDGEGDGVNIEVKVQL